MVSVVYVKMTEIEELSQFLTLETRLDVKALALQQTLGILRILKHNVNFLISQRIYFQV